MPGKTRLSLNKKIVYCSQCKKQVKEEHDSIVCDNCNNNYHVSCTGLSKKQFLHLVNNEEKEYSCHKCEENGGDGDVKEELSKIKKQLTKLDQLDQLSEMRDAITFMSKQYDEILRGVADNKKKIDAVKKENILLKSEVKELKETVKFLSDEHASKNCIIRGVEVHENETAMDTLLKISNNVGVNVNEENVENAYIIKNKNESRNKHTLIVKFNSKKSKETLMAAKSKLKEKEDTKDIYINDYLSRETLKIFEYAKSLRKVGYISVYTYNGKIYVKRSAISRPRLIKNEKDVDDLLFEATANQNKRRSFRPPDVRKDTEDDDDDDDGNPSFMSPIQ